MLPAKLTIAPDVNALASASSFIIMFTQGNKIGVTAEVSPRSKLAISKIRLVSNYNLSEYIGCISYNVSHLGHPRPGGRGCKTGEWRKQLTI